MSEITPKDFLAFEFVPMIAAQFKATITDKLHWPMIKIETAIRHSRQILEQGFESVRMVGFNSG